MNLQRYGACDASRTDGGASAAGTLLGRHGHIPDRPARRIIGVAASPRAASIRAPTSGRSRSSGESRATLRTTLPVPRRIDVGSGSSGPRCRKQGSRLRHGQPTTGSPPMPGASARTQSPGSCSCHRPLNGVRKPCPQLGPAATDPALHLRRELGDEPGQLGLRGHRSHCIGAAQPRHRAGRKAEPKKRRRRTDQPQAVQRGSPPSAGGISTSSLGKEAADRR